MLLTIKQRNGDTTVVPAIKALEMYGSSFYAHKVSEEISPGIFVPGKEFTVSEKDTGARVIFPCSTRSEAISQARKKLEQIGEEKFLIAKQNVA